MSIEIRVPVLPESVSDAVIADWHKNKGDPIRRDENLVDLETDKVVLEVPSPCDGILLDIRVETGETVTADTLLAIIEEATIDVQKAEAVAEKTPDAPSVAPAMSAEASPAAKKIAREKGVDVATLSGSGRDGRVIKEDLTQAAAAAPPPVLQDQQSGDRTEERVPMSRMRARIAQRMVESQENAVMLTSFNEVDLSAVMEIRSRYKQAFLDEHGVKLGFMSFFVKACSAALRRHPVVNASMEGDDIVYHGFQDVGIAVATEKGLVVPILRNAASMSLADVELNIANYAHQARHGGLQLSDLQGGTFTITNGGVFGSLFSTPIINPPQSAILGMHAIKERAVVVDGQVVARPMMYIALTYDHKLINGKDAVLFLVAVKNSLEDPARMLLRL